MVHICVAGGTGEAGREVVAQAVRQGHHVTVISRHPPSPADPRKHDGATYFAADVTTGEGLAAPLAGADVLIDCLEGKAGKALKTYAAGGSRLLAAASAQGVPKAAVLSIINCDRSSSAFYRSKAAKEAVYAASGLATVVVRATQFHSLLDMIFSAGRPLGLIPVFKGTRFQPISPAEAATVLLAEALADSSPATPGSHRVVTAAGPQVAGMREFAVFWQQKMGARRRIVEFPMPGAMGKYLRDGLNLAPGQPAGKQTYESWLEARLAMQRENL